MCQHHPNKDVLAEYAAGTLDVAQAIAVRAHLHYCNECRMIVHEMENVAGAMLEQIAPEPLAVDSFDQVMSAIDSTPISTRADSAQTTVIQKKHNMPTVVQRMLDDTALKWRTVNKSLKTAQLTAGQNQYEVSLQKILAGGFAPEHDHRGTEITVVLTGSFSDKNGIYQTGDFLSKEPGDIHRPVAAHNEDCLCLTIQSAPVKLTGFWGRMINPFLRIHSA